jgi:hypothetical protein
VVSEYICANEVSFTPMLRMVLRAGSSVAERRRKLGHVEPLSLIGAIHMRLVYKNELEFEN